MLANIGVTRQAVAARPAPSDENKTEYPTIILGEEHIKKLGFKELPAVGTPLAMHGRVQVTGSMMHDAPGAGGGGPERMLHLKITHMQLRNGSEGEHEETGSEAKTEKLYGESKEK
jgi:hypothetical protein